MNCVKAFRGVIVNSSRNVLFGVEECKATVLTTETVIIDEKDFKVVYEEQANKWTVLGKCRGDESPPCLEYTRCLV